MKSEMVIVRAWDLPCPLSDCYTIPKVTLDSPPEL